MKGFKKDDDARTLEDGKPVLGRIEGNVGIPGEIGHIQELASPCRTSPEKAKKRHLVAHLRKIPDVPLQIGLKIGAE